MIRKVEVERFSLTSSRSFDEVLAAINDAIGHPDMAEFWKSAHQTRSAVEQESTIQKALGRTGLMSFVQFDHGAIIRKDTGRDSPRMVRVVMGNPLIMQEMAKHVPDAGSYAPVTVLIDERSDTACICRMTEWLVCWLSTGIPTRSHSPGTSTRKSKPFC